MTSIRHAEIGRIFTMARRLSATARSAFLDEACAGEPGLRAEVEELLEADATEDPGLDARGGGADLLAGALASDGVIAATGREPPERVGKYRVLRGIAEGGMGVVYEAEHTDSGRRVALKLIRSALVTSELLRRFRREVLVLGRLHHPGIAQIHDAGTDHTGGFAQPYFAMELVAGKPIDEYATEHALDVGSRLELVARVCDALHHAHEKGVVHRDLKPANILVGVEPSTSASARTRPSLLPQPKILDFGVARAAELEFATVTAHTTDGQLVGTVPYMSPEQASGDPEAIDRRCDVYSLGVITFELLTGRLPYGVRGKLVHEAVRVIREEEPSSLGDLDSSLRGDIETIVAKALEKDPGRRYATAADMAADIRRHNQHVPITARPPSTFYRLRKFARRNKALVAGSVATVLVAVLGAAVATRFAIQSERRAQQMERASYVAGITAAAGAVAQQDYAVAKRYLDRIPQVHHGWERDYLRARLVHHVGTWESVGALVSPLVPDSEGARIFAVTAEAMVVSWDVSDGRLLERTPLSALLGIDVQAAASFGVALHGPTGRISACLPWGEIRVGRFDRGPTPAVIVAADGATAVLAWGPRGERLLYSTEDGVHLWEGGRSRRLVDEPSPRGVFSRDGSRVAVVLSPDDKRAGRLGLFDASSGERYSDCDLDDTVTDLAFSPDDRFLAVAGEYRNVYLMDNGSLTIARRLLGHRARVTSIMWSPDGARLLTVSTDRTARIFEPDAFRPPRVLRTPGAWGEKEVQPGVTRGAFVRGGAQVVIAGETVQSFPTEDAQVLRGHDSYVYRLAYSPDGRYLASSGYRESDTLLWEAREARLVARFPAPTTRSGPLWWSAALVAFSADSSRLVAGSQWETRNWDVETGEALPVSSAEDSVKRFRETLGRGLCIRGVHPAGKTFVHWLGSAVTLYSGRFMTVDGLDERGMFARIGVFGPPSFDMDRSTPVGRLEGHVGNVYCAAFHPDGSRIATGGNDGTVRIWDAETLEELLVLRGHTQYVMDVQFSPDGTQLASASGDTTIRLWDTVPIHDRLR